MPPKAGISITKHLIVTSCILSFVIGSVSPVLAHGLHGHFWTTDQATAVQTDCTIAALWAMPEMQNAVVIGASYPDGGYASGHRDIAEAAHWEPFVEESIQYILEKYGPPPYDSKAPLKVISFLMGAASHGMEDEVFDTIFLRLTDEYEGADQDQIDAGMDFVLIGRGMTVLTKEEYEYLPVDDLVEIYARPAIGIETTADDIESGWEIVKVYVGVGEIDDPDIGEDYEREMPWTADHVFDPDTPGSIAYESLTVARYHKALWQRLNATFMPEDILIRTEPEAGQRLRSNAATSAESRVSLMFGIGVEREGMTPENFEIVDDHGDSVSATVHANRWGGTSRVMQLRPQVDLKPDSAYTIRITGPFPLVDETIWDNEIIIPFRSACIDGQSCPPTIMPAATKVDCTEHKVELIAAPVTDKLDDDAVGCNSTRRSSTRSDLAFLLLLLLPLMINRAGCRLP